jgi:hypothetical protein
MSAETQNIPIKDLFLWDNNARFPDQYFNTEEKELVQYFLSKPDFKIKELIEEIVKDFDLPQLEKLVVWKDNGRLVVLEGNRRLTGYKLLNKPSMAMERSLITYLEAQKRKISISDAHTLECVITEDKERGLRYVDRKHANGNNEVNWQDAERANYNVRRGRGKHAELIKIGISNIIKTLDIPQQMKEEILGKGFVTTFFRIITSSAAIQQYGFKINEKTGELTVTDKDFSSKLKVIILNVLKKHDLQGKPVDSRSMNRKEAQAEYLKSIKKKDEKVVDTEIKKSTTHDLFGGKNVAVTAKAKILPKSTARNHLIPATCRLTINETKINNIYIELKDDLLLDDSNKAVPNAVGVLFRVFLEISIDCFMEKAGIHLPDGTKLSGKITKCCDFMETENIAAKKQLVNIRKVATDKHHILGIQNFHDYVHSYKTQPSPSDLKLKWDNLEEFFQLLWNNMSSRAQVKKAAAKTAKKKK